jgi:soluble P-type ATPase
LIRVEIPGRDPLEISHLALDLNGTLATDGKVPVEVEQRLQELASALAVHILTADTFGTASRLAGLGIRVSVLGPGDQTAAKAAAIRAFGVAHTAAIGNGMNDEAMLRDAALGILVVGQEGAAVRSLLAADLVVRSIEDALDLFRTPKRLVASLRTG